MAVDQDIVDGRVLEQRFERPEARHLVEDFRDEVVELLGIEREPFDQHVLRYELLDVVADLLFRQFLQRRKIDFLDQPTVQPHLGVEQLVGEQRVGGGRHDRLGRRLREHRPGNAFERRFLGGGRELGSGNTAR